MANQKIGIQFCQLVEDSRGNSLPDPDKSMNGTKLTLGRACELALDSPLQEDANEGLKKKLSRGLLIEQILQAEKGAQPMVVKAEDIALMKERVAKVFTAASTVRRICKMLDEATE